MLTSRAIFAIAIALAIFILPIAWMLFGR